MPSKPVGLRYVLWPVVKGIDCVHKFKTCFSLIPQVGCPHTYLKIFFDPCSPLEYWTTGIFSRKLLFVLGQNSSLLQYY